MWITPSTQARGLGSAEAARQMRCVYVALMYFWQRFVLSKEWWIYSLWESNCCMCFEHWRGEKSYIGFLLVISLAVQEACRWWGMSWLLTLEQCGGIQAELPYLIFMVVTHLTLFFNCDVLTWNFADGELMIMEQGHFAQLVWRDLTQGLVVLVRFLC